MQRLQKGAQLNRLTIWALILLITILWGYAWVVMKQSLTYMGPLTFSSLRFLSGTLTLLLFIWLTKQHIPLKKYWRQLLILGILQTAIVFTLVTVALQFVGAGKSSMLLYSMPIWSSLLATFYLHEKPSLFGWIGLLLGLIGLVIILGMEFFSGQDRNAFMGQTLIIIASFSWAISNIYFRLHLQHLPRVTTTTYQMLFGTIGLIFATFLFERHLPLDINALSIYYILFAGVIASALCFSIWYILLSSIDMMTATISSMLVPIFGLFFSSLILDEHLSFNLMLGSCIIIVGIVMTQFKNP